MKKIIFAFVIFSLILMNSYVFAEGDILGSITVKHIDKDTLEILETEFFDGLEIGEYTLSSIFINNYELDDTVTKTVYLEEREHQEINFKYIKIPEVVELEYDNLVHVSYINQESGEVFFAKSYPAPIGETYQIPIPMFYEDEMLEVAGTDGGWIWYSDYPFEDEFMPYELDYYNIDESYLSNLTIFIPSSEENKVYSYTMNITVNFKKVIPQVLVNYFDGEELLDGELIEFDNLGEKTITAKEIEGYEVVGNKTQVIEFKFPDNQPFYFQKVNFEYKKIDDKTIPIPIPKPLPPKFEPIQPTIPTITEEPEEVIIIENIPIMENIPLTENIPEGEFVSRWKGHKIIEKPIKYSEKEIIKIELSNKLLEKGLQPRFYKWNTQKEKWVALATKINGNTVETYEKVGGYVALFGVKQPRFDDVKGDEWFIEKLDRANGFALIEGIEDGEQLKLEPNKELTRKELYTMVARIFGAVPKGQTSLYNELDSIDEGQGSDWYIPYLQEFHNAGIIDKEFSKEHADEKVTRLEALELLTKMLNRVENVDTLDLSKFNDVDNVNVRIASVVDGFPDGTLRLNNNLSRIEVITIIVNVLEELGW